MGALGLAILRMPISRCRNVMGTRLRLLSLLRGRKGMSRSMNKAHSIVRFDSPDGALTVVAILERVDEGAPLEAAP
jgi:hypothetical protein